MRRAHYHRDRRGRRARSAVCGLWIIGNAIGPGVLHPANLNPERLQEAEQAIQANGRNENRFHRARERRGRTARLESRSCISERRLGPAFSRRLRQSHRRPGPRGISPSPRLQRRDDGFARPRKKRRRHGHLRLERTLRHRRDHRRTLRNRENPPSLRARGFHGRRDRVAIRRRRAAHRRRLCRRSVRKSSRGQLTTTRAWT